jgi:sodium transport system ATP-binding protein
MIRAEGLKRRFGPVEALRGVSFEAADGAITGLLGPNGAGKSTTLRILATVLASDAGTASVDGLDVAAAPLDARRRLGVLPHGAGLYPQLTGRENIAYFARLAGLAGPRLERRLDALAGRLGLSDFQHRRASGYSQGQRTRVALARALVHEPANLLLDEPTAGLDVMATRGLRALLGELRDEGICIVFSSHVMQEVANLCDRIVILARGRVALAGSADEIRHTTGEQDLEEAFVRVTGEAAP